MKNALTFICAASLTLTSLSPAFALTGPIGSGGGNSVNAQMVEDYRVKSVVTDARFAGIISFLTKLKVQSPGLARNLTEDFMGLKWYVVATDLRELPEYQTGLSFNSDQTAFQRAGEVFINENLLQPMIQQNSQTTLFLHELLMSEVLKRKGQADAADHARVRKMTADLMDNLMGEQLNGSILTNGFVESARADVWHYTLITSKPGLTPDGGLVLVRKASRMVFYRCGEAALTDIRERQASDMSSVPQGMQYLISQALRQQGCALVDKSMYTLSPDFIKAATQSLEDRQTKAGIVGMAAGVAATEAVIFAKMYRSGARLGSDGVLGMIVVGALVLVPSSFVGGAAAMAAMSVTSKMDSAQSQALSIGGESYDFHPLILVDASVQATQEDLFKGLNQLVDKHFVFKTSVQ